MHPPRRPRRQRPHVMTSVTALTWPSAGHHPGQPIGAPATICTLAPRLLMRSMHHPRPAATRRAPQRPRHAVSPVYWMRLVPIAPAICPHTHPMPTPAVVHACPCDTSACFGPDQHVPAAPTRCVPFPTHPCTTAHQRQLRWLPALAPTCRLPPTTTTPRRTGTHSAPCARTAPHARASCSTHPRRRAAVTPDGPAPSTPRDEPQAQPRGSCPPSR